MIRSRTVVTAAEIMATLPADEDSMYTVWGKLKSVHGEFNRCQAAQGTPDHCPREASGRWCEGHEMRLRKPPQSCAWDAPIAAKRGRPKRKQV